MKSRKDSSDHTHPQLEEDNAINAENRVGIEGYLKIALADLEEDYDVKQRIQAIEYILKPKKEHDNSENMPHEKPKNPLEIHNPDAFSEVKEIKATYRSPVDLAVLIRTRQPNYKVNDILLLEEIRSIMKSVLLHEIKKLCPEHDLVTQSNRTQPLEEKKAHESWNIPVQTDFHNETYSESSGQHGIDAKIVPSDDICRQEEGLLSLVEEFMPVIWLQYPIGSPRMFYVYLKMVKIFKQFNLPSYKILDQEYNEIRGLRGKFDNIIIYLTPDLSLEQVMRLLAVLGEPKTRNEEVFLDNIKFDLERNHFKETGHYRKSIEDAFLRYKDLKRRGSSPSSSWVYLFSMNCLLRHDLKRWVEKDVVLAKNLITDFDQKELKKREDVRGVLKLPSAELEISIANYYYEKDRLGEARDYYISALLRLGNDKIKSLDIYVDYNGSVNFSLNRPFLQSAKRLSALIRCLDRLIVVELRLGKSDLSVNEHIRYLNENIDELQQLEPYTILSISKRDEIPVLISSEEKSKRILENVQPKKPFPRSSFFSGQIENNLKFDLMTLLDFVHFPVSKVIHLKKHLPSGLEFYLETIEDAKKLYHQLLHILADGNKNKYKGHIFLHESDCRIDITFDAYRHLKLFVRAAKICNDRRTNTEEKFDVHAMDKLREIYKDIVLDNRIELTWKKNLFYNLERFGLEILNKLRALMAEDNNALTLH